MITLVISTTHFHTLLPIRLPISFLSPTSTSLTMASLLCIPSCPKLTKANSSLQLQQKPSSLVSFPCVRSQARDESKKSPTYQPRTQLSSAALTTEPIVASDTQNSSPVDLDQTVEHIVFLEVEEDKTKPWGVADALNSLKCLPGTLYLAAGNVGDTYGSPGNFNFFLHSRLATQKHRDRFMQHPLKYGFSMGYTENLCPDFMMLDYIHKHEDPLKHPVYGAALRFVFLKLKDVDSVDIASLGEVIRKYFPGSVLPPTFGRVIEPCFTVPGTEADAVKGYNFAMHGTFSSVAGLDALGTPEVFAKKLKNEIGEKLVDGNSIFIHDYDINDVYGGTFV